MVTKVSFVPLGERIVILPMEQESTTKGGIYLPDTAKEKPQEGEVLARWPSRSAHGSWVDAHGDIYLALTAEKSIDKYVRQR